MKSLATVFLSFLIGFFLTACLGNASNTQMPVTQIPATQIPVTQIPVKMPDLLRTDSQGAVTVEIRPLNLDNPGKMLTFDVKMDTHLVELDMDLRMLATLTTDDPQRMIQADQWEGSKGGHHVQGKLSFPTTYDEKSLLDGATQVTVTIRNVDVPIRQFTWQLKK